MQFHFKKLKKKDCAELALIYCRGKKSETFYDEFSFFIIKYYFELATPEAIYKNVRIRSTGVTHKSLSFYYANMFVILSALRNVVIC